MKKMIKTNGFLLTMLVCLIMSVLMVGCKERRDKMSKSDRRVLQMEIDEVNRQCPKNLGLFGYIHKVWLDEDTVVFEAQVNHDILNVEKLKKGTDLMKEASLLSAVESPFVDVVLKHDIDLKFVFNDSVNNEQLKLLLTHDDLVQTMSEKKNNEKEFNERRMDNQFEVTRLQLPMDIDEVTRLVDFSREGDNAVYTYEIDSSQVSPAFLKETMPNIKSQTRMVLSMGDPSIRSLLMILKNVGWGLVYRYKLGNVVEEFSFTPEELSEITPVGLSDLNF